MSNYRPSTDFKIWRPAFWIFFLGQLFNGAFACAVLFIWAFVLKETIPTWGYALAFICGNMASERVDIKPK